MRRKGKTGEELVDELAELRQRAVHLEAVETERVQAEESLRESEDRYRDLVEHSHDLICTHDLEGQILSVNRAAERLLGYEQSVLLKMNIRDILAPEAKDEFDTYLAIIQRQGAASGLMPVQMSTGEKRIWEYDNTLRTGVAAPVVRGMARDITERQQAEVALRESEQRLRSFINNSPDTIYILDPAAHELVYFNRDEFCGYSRDELTSDNLILQAVHPDDLVAVRKHWQAMLQAEIDEVRSIEYRLQAKNGDWEWIQDRRTILSRDAKGAPAQVLVTLSVVTERKRAESALYTSESFLNSIIEQAPYAMWISDDKGTLIRLNQACRDLLSISDEDVVGKYNVLKDNIVQEQGFLPLVKSVFEKGETVRFTIKYDSSQLEQLELARTIFVILDTTIFPVKNANESITNAIIQHIDITERELAEEYLRASERLLRVIADNYPNSYLSIIERDLTVGFTSGKEFKRQELDPDSFVGLSLDQVFGEHATIVRENYLRAFDGEDVTFELSISNQHQVYNVVPLFEEDGRINRILAVVENVTERKQAEDELRKHRDHLEELVKERTAEMRKVINAMTGREIRMIGLKEAIRQLRAQLEAAGLTPVADDPLSLWMTE